MKERIIILGANGQIGTELAITLRNKYGAENVITTDLNEPKNKNQNEVFYVQDILDKSSLRALFEQYKPTQVYALAAMLSATAEKYPKKAWDLNMEGLFNVLDLAVEFGVNRVFWPSSIAAFGPNSSKVNCPQYGVMDPNTIYGISKQAGERYCEYYYNKHNLDVRSIRYPGIISWKTVPGGGTTDYAVEIYFEALKSKSYASFLNESSALPMMYMPDAVRATIELMEAPKENISIRSSYNLAAMTFTPEEVAESIKKQIPDFELSYAVDDVKQRIADSWPQSIDDSFARNDWGWKPEFDLDSMTKDMLENIAKLL